MAQWIRRPPTERKIPGSIPGVGVQHFASTGPISLFIRKAFCRRFLAMSKSFGCPTSKLLVGQPKKSQNRKAFCQRFLAMSKSFACLCGKKPQSSSQRKMRASTPGIEPGIFRSVGGRLIHWAMRNEAQEDLMQNWMHKPKI